MSASPFTYGIETITWEECARLVQNCEARNRPIAAKRVDTLARAVDGRRFYMTHQGVALDPARNVIDGQHRLAAHAKTKTDYVGLVCRYTDAVYAARVMAVFDSGRSRSTADGLAIGGVMKSEEARDATAVANVLHRLLGEDRGKALDLQETSDVFELHKAAIRWAISAVPKARGGAVIRAAFALAWEVAPAKVSEFAAQVCEGAAAPGSAAALWNRALADGLLDPSGGSDKRREACLRALRILKAHISGEKTPDKLYTSEEALAWFMKATGMPAPEVSPIARLSPLETKILAAIPKNGARLGDIARAVERHPTQVRHNLDRMETVGVVKKPETGFYVRAA
jgi:hypothetical protein